MRVYVNIATDRHYYCYIFFCSAIFSLFSSSQAYVAIFSCCVKCISTLHIIYSNPSSSSEKRITHRKWMALSLPVSHDSLFAADVTHFCACDCELITSLGSARSRQKCIMRVVLIKPSWFCFVLSKQNLYWNPEFV